MPSHQRILAIERCRPHTKLGKVEWPSPRRGEWLSCVTALKILPESGSVESTEASLGRRARKHRLTAASSSSSLYRSYDCPMQKTPERMPWDAFRQSLSQERGQLRHRGCPPRWRSCPRAHPPSHRSHRTLFLCSRALLDPIPPMHDARPRMNIAVQ